MTKTLVFTPPPADAPGYPRRVHKVLKLQEALGKGPSADVWQELVDFLAQFITEPADPKEAREALWDATEEQFFAMLNELGSIGGGEENPT